MTSQSGSGGRRASLLAPWERSRQKSITSFFSSQKSAGGRGGAASPDDVNGTTGTPEGAVSTPVRPSPASVSDVISPALFSAEECESRVTGNVYRSENRLSPSSSSVGLEGTVERNMAVISDSEMDDVLDQSGVSRPQLVGTGRPPELQTRLEAPGRDVQRLMRQVDEVLFGGEQRCGASVCPAAAGQRCRISEWGDQLAYQRLGLLSDLDLKDL